MPFDQSCCYLADIRGWSHPLTLAGCKPLILCHILLPADSVIHPILCSSIIWYSAGPTEGPLVLDSASKPSGTQNGLGKAKQLSLVLSCLSQCSLQIPFPAELSHLSVYSAIFASLFFPLYNPLKPTESRLSNISISSSTTFAFMGNISSILYRDYSMSQFQPI